MKKEVLIYEGKRSLFSILGAFLYAAGINLFVVPAELYTGGLMGICQVIRTLLAEAFELNFQGVDIAGIIYYIFNIPVFVIAFTKMGRKFFGKTLITVTMMTVFMALLPTAVVVQDAKTSSRSEERRVGKECRL